MRFFAKRTHAYSGISEKPLSALFEEPDDAATPLTPQEMRDLIPAHIAYRSELNEAEQANIVRGQEWALSRRRDIFSEKFIKNLHRQMLGDVWRWAGKFRTSERNLGIDYWQNSDRPTPVVGRCQNVGRLRHLSAR
jgi:fido (protein-threonine AMPylation protein)